MKLIIYFILFIFWYLSCNRDSTEKMLRLADKEVQSNVPDSVRSVIALPVTLPDTVKRVIPLPVTVAVNTQNASPENIIAYAKTLIGVPYKYGSTDPALGFDCSGFITNVFNHFDIKVPRSSVDFTNVGREVPLPEAKAGDLVLFTGTDSLIRVVGHMGIITENTDSLRFIHSTSGRQYGVTITALGNYYKGRFVKVIRIF